MSRFYDSGAGVEVKRHAIRNERIAFDKKSLRTFDENGFLHVSMSPISKEAVNDYYGSEIPGWEKLGLEANRIYRGYRPASELQKGALTFNGLNILSEHIKDDAEDPPKDYIVGSMGTDANFSAPYLRNSLIIKDAESIEAINPKDPSKTPKREISASYRYDPVFKPGVFNNKRYDFVMTNIRGNHIALVEEGRAGPDVVVSDENTIKKGKKGLKMNPLKIIEDLIASLKAAGVAPHEGGEEEAEKFMETSESDVEEFDNLEEKEEGAEDDALEGALTELFALADSVQDEELAVKLREVGDAIREAQGGEGEESMLLGDEEEVEEKFEKKEVIGDKDKTAMDRKLKRGRKLSVRGKGNTYNVTVPMANDAAIVKKVEARINAKIAAARACAPLVGDVDPLAFDSASSLYRGALKASGINTSVTDPVALKEMVLLAIAGKPKDYVYPVVGAAMANDSKSGKEDPNFAGLGNIRRA